MDELDIGLSKKSKIIEIGSVKKKLWLFKVGGIWKNPKIPDFSYSYLRIFLQKLSQIYKKSENLEKVFLIALIQFWLFYHNIWYTLT